MHVYEKIPADFNSVEYKSLHPDLIHFSDIDALNHFKNNGIYEGRLYKKNQIPLYLEHYLNLIGFKL